MRQTGWGAARITTEPPAETADRLATGVGLGFDTWIVAGPWPQIAQERALSNGKLFALELATPIGGPARRAVYEPDSQRALPEPDRLGLPPPQTSEV